MRKIRNLLLVGVILITHNIFGQQTFYKGMVFDDKAYAEAPLKARLTLKSYSNLPSNYSLKQYAPIPKSQGEHGTCTGWATGWAFRTILEAEKNNWTNKTTITNKAFSPLFVYYFAKVEETSDCSRGGYIDEALQAMVDYGIPYFNDFSEMCTNYIPKDILEKATKHKIKGYNRLFNSDDSDNLKISSVKQSLNNGSPVVIGIICPNSLFYAKGVWVPTEAPLLKYGGHAITVVGYDDAKYGGAFELMNSWGNDWGNEGFIWVKYSDFSKFARYAYEAYLEKEETIIKLAGSVKFAASDNMELPVTNINDFNQKGQTTIDANDDIGDYKIVKPMQSGDEYRLFVTSKEPVYMYVISSDLSNNVSVLFPHKSGISPYLSYSTNEIPIPNEKYWIQLDNNTGTDYTCIIYSINQLDINAINTKIKSQQGNYKEKVEHALGNSLIKSKEANFSKDKISFSASSSIQSIVAIIVEMEHK